LRGDTNPIYLFKAAPPKWRKFKEISLKKSYLVAIVTMLSLVVWVTYHYSSVEKPVQAKVTSSRTPDQTHRTTAEAEGIIEKSEQVTPTKALFLVRIDKDKGIKRYWSTTGPLSEFSVGQRVKCEKLDIQPVIKEDGWAGPLETATVCDPVK
jgi:hypothetical protein